VALKPILGLGTGTRKGGGKERGTSEAFGNSSSIYSDNLMRFFNNVILSSISLRFFGLPRKSCLSSMAICRSFLASSMF
jgi:hypothetical protein